MKQLNIYHKNGVHEKFEVEEDHFEIGTIIINACREYYLSGPLIALVLEGQDAIQIVRALIGNTMPSKAEKGTIRGDFGLPETIETLSATRNLIHASDAPDEADREIACWFTPDEIKSFSK